MAVAAGQCLKTWAGSSVAARQAAKALQYRSIFSKRSSTQVATEVTPLPARQLVESRLELRGIYEPCYPAGVQFEWDPRKAASNEAKHGVSFEEATTVFGDPLATTVPDPNHSIVENRLLTTGRSRQERVVICWHTEADDTIRIIGARIASPRERRIYESGE